MREILVIVLIITSVISSLYIPLDLAYAQFLFPNQSEGNDTTTSNVNNTEESNQQNAASTLLTYEDLLFGFRLSYPSNLTKYTIGTLNLATNAGHGTITEVGFGLPGKNRTFFTVAVGREPGNFLLRDYVAEEITALSTFVGYKQFESSPTTIGGNPAHKIVYSYSLVRNGVEAGQIKAMEIVTIRNVEPFFIEYAITANEYQKYLPLAQKMIDSFQFTGTGITQ